MGDNTRDLDRHERMIYNMSENRVRAYREALDDEVVSLTEQRFKLLQSKEKLIERIDRQLENIELRMKEINYDISIIEGLCLPPPPDSDEDEDDKYAFWSGVLY